MSPIEFLHPAWLLLLPLIGLWVGYCLRANCESPSWWPALTLRYPLLAELDSEELTTPSRRHRQLIPWLIGMGLLSSVIALSQPIRWGQPLESEQHPVPLDMMLIVSTAVTMNLQDYALEARPVSRMQMMQTFLQHFITAYPGERLGLMVLGDPPLKWLPLTSDKRLVENAVGRLKTTLGGRLSDTAAALNLAAQAFQGRTTQTRAIVLLSDAGLQVGSQAPEDAAAVLRQSDIRLYTIAIGSTDNTGTQQDPFGLLYEPVDLTLLQKLAELGGGHMFHATNSQAMADALQRIANDFRNQRPPPEKYRRQIALYPLFIGGALLLIGAALLLPAVSTQLPTRYQP